MFIHIWGRAKSRKSLPLGYASIKSKQSISPTYTSLPVRRRVFLDSKTRSIGHRNSTTRKIIREFCVCMCVFYRSLGFSSMEFIRPRPVLESIYDLYIAVGTNALRRVTHARTVHIVIIFYCPRSVNADKRDIGVVVARELPARSQITLAVIVTQLEIITRRQTK